MKKEDIKKILEKQLVRLSEESQKKDITPEQLCHLTGAISSLVGFEDWICEDC